VASMKTDVLIIGSGIAGLSFALKASRYADVILVTKKSSAESATNWAQGGIAAVTAANRSGSLQTGRGQAYRRVRP